MVVNADEGKSGLETGGRGVFIDAPVWSWHEPSGHNVTDSYCMATQNRFHSATRGGRPFHRFSN